MSERCYRNSQSMSMESLADSEKKGEPPPENIATNLNFTKEELRPFATLLLATIASKMLQEEGGTLAALAKELFGHQAVKSIGGAAEATSERRTTEQAKADLVKDLLRS